MMGMEIMLKQMGLDVPAMMQQFQQLLKFAESVDTRLSELQKKIDEKSELYKKIEDIQRKINALEVVEENGNGNSD